MPLWPPIQAIVLLLVANGTPIVAKKVFGRRFALPLDLGCIFYDRQPLLGTSKTVRGLVVSLLSTGLVGPLLGIPITAGVWFAFWAMIGDLLSSFIKRRLQLRPSTQAIGLDQIPESLFPLLVCQTLLGLDLADIAGIIVAFFISELALSRLLYSLRIRDQPY